MLRECEVMSFRQRRRGRRFKVCHEDVTKSTQQTNVLHQANRKSGIAGEVEKKQLISSN